MRYLFLMSILILTSCSLNKNSIYWNEHHLKNSLENKKLSKILNENLDLKSMTFEEFSLFLKAYSDKGDYPDISK